MLGEFLAREAGIGLASGPIAGDDSDYSDADWCEAGEAPLVAQSAQLPKPDGATSKTKEEVAGHRSALTKIVQLGGQTQDQRPHRQEPTQTTVPQKAVAKLGSQEKASKEARDLEKPVADERHGEEQQKKQEQPTKQRKPRRRRDAAEAEQPPPRTVAGMPTSKAGFKRNRTYVLESQLLQNEVIYPLSARPAGLFQGKEPVWNRRHVVALHTEVQWRRKGRQVLTGERAQKSLKNCRGQQVPLYGLWQTEPLVLAEVEADADPVAEGGPIPGTNNYGNIEILPGSDTAQALPRGTVHLADNEARAAAIRLGVPFAAVVVGFERDRGQVKPRYGGVAVWQRDEEAVREGAAVEKARRQEIAEKAKEERMEATWRLLVKSILVDRYVEANYGQKGGRSNSSGPQPS